MVVAPVRECLNEFFIDFGGSFRVVIARTFSRRIPREFATEIPSDGGCNHLLRERNEIVNSVCLNEGSYNIPSSVTKNVWIILEEDHVLGYSVFYLSASLQHAGVPLPGCTVLGA